MTPTPVGMRCPECASQRTKIVRNPGGAPQAGFWGAPATYVLIAINVVAYLIEISAGGGGFSVGFNSVSVDFGLFGPSVAEGEWYRLITSGFLHANLLHIGFNMLLLFMLGRLLEPSLGTPRFLLLYFASLLAGSFGALLMDPNALTVGASGAVFGLVGAGVLLARERGMHSLAGELGFLIVFNLVFSFTVRGISAGGHLGGLAGGLLCAAVIIAGARGMLGPNHRVIEYVAMIAIGAISFVGAIAVA
ncbi:MAG: rhomboid family intramembrane serine protease [Solirubrobacterales bacterium]